MLEIPKWKLPTCAQAAAPPSQRFGVGVQNLILRWGGIWDDHHKLEKQQETNLVMAWGEEQKWWWIFVYMENVWHFFFNIMNFKVRYSRFLAGIGSKLSRLHLFILSRYFRHPDIYLLSFGLRCLENVYTGGIPLNRACFTSWNDKRTKFITHDAQSVLPVVLAWKSTPPRSQQVPFLLLEPLK